MRGNSHIFLGKYLVSKYMQDTADHHIAAFLIGCVEPDRNPLTYLKGSFRHQWLRGHNYRNARRFMRRISRRLEQKEKWKLWDYYTLGKLIHYTADAFTYAHNDTFPTELSQHKQYERQLQIHFMEYLQQEPGVDLKTADNVMEAISGYHREYARQDSGLRTDSKFALAACCCVLSMLVMKPVFT